MLLSALKKRAGSTAGETGDNDPMREPSLGPTIFIASGAINILALALPITILQIYDRVLPNAAFETLSALIGALVGVIIIDGLLKYFRSSIVNWSAASFTHKLGVRALSTMLATRPSKHSQTTASEHMERLNAITGLGGHIGGQSRIVAVDILFIPIFASVIILVGGMIFFAVLALFAIFGYLAFRRTKSLNSTIAEREKHETRKHDFIIEVLQAIQTVKSMAMEPLMMRRFERLQSAASVITKRMIILTGSAQTYNTLYASLSIVTIVGTGAILVINGRLTLGALACCMLLSSQLLQPLMRSLASWNELQLAKHRRARVSGIFEGVDGTITPATQTFSRNGGPKRVALNNISIRYGDAPPLFEGLNLNIPAGAMIAIKGADGSGRSSLLRALMDDTPYPEGEIWIGDNCDLRSARSCVAYVGQTPTIFRGTILENLTLFGEAPAKTALTASRFIGLDEEISRMPLGYDTMLKSAAGRDIPAPTAQRICIARALALKPSVLILDEANTLLDLAGEQQFTNALAKLRGKITIILATHRPSLIRLADEVYEIEDGELRKSSPEMPQETRVAS